MTAESISFERAAEYYDRTRGGMERGRRFATKLDGLLTTRSDRVLEIGVGTGLIALSLAELGYDVIGVDIAHAMLEKARIRIGARVAQGDAAQLPVASASFDAVLAVWILHVAGDTSGVLRETARVLKPGGRLIVVSADAQYEPDDINQVIGNLRERLGRIRDLAENLIPLAAPAGLHLRATDATEQWHHEASPEQVAAQLERREMSSLWDLDEEQWSRIVQPVIDGLRALPNPEKPRPEAAHHPIFIFEKA
jgi:ubiquinone/menaquinone biosynthesis C-methylase UbiE